MSKIGLKLLTTDFDIYCNEAIELFKQRIFDYIELYVVPNTTQLIDKWADMHITTPNGLTLKIPFMLHAPDHKYGVNLSIANNFENNKTVYEQVEQYRQKLKSKCTVISPGYGGFIGETIRQLKILRPQNILIKNNVYKLPEINNTNGVGATLDEISKIKNELSCGFCLDIGNAVCSANSQSKNPYEYLREYNSFNPIIYRISGNDITSTVNKHMSLESATYDYSIISLIIRNNALITINADKTSDELKDFKSDVRFLRRYCK